MSLDRLRGDLLISKKISNSLSRPYAPGHANPNIVRMIQQINELGDSNLRCYEFGCGAGTLGKILLENQMIKGFAGCDSSSDACAIAQGEGLDVENAECEVVLSSIPKSSIQYFNLFIYADVLEHLEDPWTHLRDLNLKVQPGSWVVISVPCFFHHSNLKSIARMDFEYEEWGVMDITHLRHFGLKNIMSLLNLTGFPVSEELPLLPSFDPEGYRLYESSKNRLPIRLAFGDMQITIKDHQQLLQVCAYQFIVAAKKK